MAGSKSAYLRNKILDITLSGASNTWTSLGTVYVALSTAAFSASSVGSSFSEVSNTSTGYARVAVTANSTNFPAASGGSKSNGTAINFPAATATWGTVTSFYILDASTNGNVLYGGDLTTARTILSGDTASFASAALTFTET